MLGAIIGDIIGSAYEWHPTKNKRFKLFTEKSNFTDDTVMTCATLRAIRLGVNYEATYYVFGNNFEGRGYGGSFQEWLKTSALKRKPYNSWGNGSAMRVSPIGWMFDSVKQVLREARRSAECTHNDPEGIKGAQATALAVFYARKGKSKKYIKDQLEKRFKYDLTRKLSSFKRSYKFEVSCQKSVPEAIICFLESKDYIDAIRNAIALGGDADTQAAIAGGIAEAYYKYIPERIIKRAWKLLPVSFKNDLLNHSSNDYKKHMIPSKFFNNHDKI